MDISTDRLRHYYEHSYGRNGPSNDAFDGCTFDEYYYLRCIDTPDVTRWNAAIRAPNPEFRELAKSFEHEVPEKEKPKPVRSIQFRRKPKLDLGEGGLDPEAEMLLLDRVKLFSGIGNLSSLELSKATFLFCDTDDASLDKRLNVEDVAIQECSTRCLHVLLDSLSAKKAKVFHYDQNVLDLQPLAGHSELESLYVVAPKVRGLSHLKKTPLKQLLLANIELDKEFEAILKAKQKTLEKLWVENYSPFGTSAFSQLGSFKSLKQVRVSAGNDFRDEWIDFAISHPTIGFQFVGLKDPPSKTPFVEIAEFYRGLEIYRIEKGKSVSYELAGNLAGDWIGSGDLNNHDVSDVVSEVAKAEKKKIKVSSSSDHVTVAAGKPELLRWCIDQLADRYIE